MTTTLITVNGTGSPDPFGPGFSGELGANIGGDASWNRVWHELTGDNPRWYWQPIGYPAATFPMGPSVQAGRAQVNQQIGLRPKGTKLALSGYSQGALVVDYVWRDDILNPQGQHHDRLGDVVGIVNFGDPMRCPGVCNGNVHAGFPIPGQLDGFTTGGISGPSDLKPDQTPDFLLSCNNDGDLYGAAPVGDAPWTTAPGVGHDETLIFNLVQNFDGVNLLAFVQEAMTTLGVAMAGGINLGTLISVTEAAIVGALGTGGIPGIPAAGAQTPDHVVAIVEALLNGGMFVMRGFGPHGDYEKYVPAMLDFLNSVAA